VLKIDADVLPTAPLGHSGRLVVGETVVAIGSPLWIEGGPSVTVGIVSGLRRSMEEESLPILHDLIQTDAAINHGNSGGPLINMAGEVVGINTALMPTAHGIGFAISIDSVKPVLAQLIAGARVTHRSLGVYAVTVTPQVAFVNDLAIERGALVIRVDRSGPADVAGLRAGDVIRGIGGQRIDDLHAFHALLDRQEAGVPLALDVWRDGRGVALRAVPVEEP
jgi:serine protease Do